MTRRYELYVAAEPKRRHRMAAGRAYPDPRGKSYETMLGHLMRIQRKGPILTGEIEVGILFVTTSRGDTDNLAKAVLDAGNGVLWEDDRQITSVNAVKRKPEKGEPEKIVLNVIGGWR